MNPKLITAFIKRLTERDAQNNVMLAKMNKAVVEAIGRSKTDPNDIAKAVAEQIKQLDIKSPDIKMPDITVPEPKVTVNVPDINIPEIKLPKITVPKPEVTVNVPKPDPVEVSFGEFKLPDKMDVNVVNKTLKVMNVDPKGNFITPTSGGAGGRTGITKAQMEEVINPETVVAGASTASPLSASDTWTSDWIDTEGYSSIKIAVKTDQNGSFVLQYSVDKTNVDSTLTRYYRTNQIEAPHKFENMRRYVRIVYTNGSTDQSYLRLETTLTNSAGILNIPVDANMSQDYDAISVRPTDYHYETALNRRQGSTTWNKFGENDDLDNADGEQVVWPYKESFSYLESPSKLYFYSTQGTDTTAGSGAQTLYVYGIDSTHTAINETIVMNGTSSVTTEYQYYGVNRVAVTSSGANDTNDGEIKARATSDDSLQVVMQANGSVTQQCIFHVQQDHIFLADWLEFNVNKTGAGGAPRVRINGYVYDYGVDTRFKVYSQTIDSSVENTVDLNPSQPFVVAGPSILYFTAEVLNAVNDVVVFLRFSGIEVRDVDA